MKRGRKWIRKGAQVTMVSPVLSSNLGGVVGYVVGAAAAVHLEGDYYQPRWIARDSEGTDWIRGWHKPESPALKALLAAYSLKERAA